MQSNIVHSYLKGFGVTQGVHCPPGVYSDIKVGLNTVNSLRLERDAENFKLEIELAEEFIEHRSFSSMAEASRSFSIILSLDDLIKIIHNSCAIPLLGFQKALNAMDVRLSKIKTLGDDADRMTPDMIEKVADGDLKTWNVLEIAAPEANVQRAFDTKMQKYLFPLQQRSSGCVINFGILICSQNEVMTNLPLEMDMLFLIQSFRSVGVHVHTMALAKGFVSLTEDLRVSYDELFAEETGIIAQCQPRIPLDQPAPMINMSMLHLWRDFRESEKDFTDISSWMINSAADWMQVKSAKSKGKKYIADFVRACNDQKTRSTMKSICRVPMLYVTSNYISSNGRGISDMLMPETSTPLQSIWNKGFNEVLLLSPSLRGYAVQDGEEQISADARRKLNNRITLTFSRDEEEYLLSRGIYGKKSKNTAIGKSSKEESKLPFALHTDTGDIDYFIEKEIFQLLTPSEGVDIENHFNMELIMTALSRFENKGVTNSFVSGFCRTSIGKSLHHLGCILEELNLSFAQTCHGKQMIFKKIRGYNTYLMIRSITASKPLWYSVYHSGSSASNQTIFLKTQKVGYGDVTDFESINRHKIASYMFPFEKAISLLAMWCEVYGVQTEQFWGLERSEPAVSEAIKHWALSLLTLFEGKAQTSTEILQTRYMYMECMKSSLYMDSGLKVLTKMESKPRSRLLVWYYKRWIEHIPKMEANMMTRPHFKGIDETKEPSTDSTVEASDQTVDLISFVTGNPFPSFEAALNVMYLGVLHNKDESDETQGYFKIFVKCIKEELEMRKARKPFMGTSEPADLSELRDHEFSYRAALMAGDASSAFLNKKYGNYETRLREKMSRQHFLKTMDSVATFKASAIRDQLGVLRDDSRDTTKRVMEGILDELKIGSSVHVFTHLPRILRYLEDNKMMASLFKKLQLGGVREIFILDIKTRLMALFIETLSRMICEDLPHEMLTKGDAKIKKNDSHFARVAALVRKDYMEVSMTCSDDATTWAQRFIMPVFGAVLSRILPRDIFLVCVRILNCFTQKQLLLPTKLLRQFIHNPDVDSLSSPEMNELKAQFFGLTDTHDLIEQGSRLLQNQSNMMQGILHYTSSLIHASFLLLHSRMVRGLFNLSITDGHLPPDCLLINSYQCSSDDSAEIGTIMLKRREDSRDFQEDVKRALIFLTQVGVMKERMYPLFSASQSRVKSTTCNFAGMIEFNSYFMFRNTLMMPVIKFVYAALNPPPTLSIMGRQHVMSGMRKNVIENGGSFFLGDIIQRCQASIHYKCLGYYTSDFFPLFVDQIREKPIPELGFFVLEPPLLAGLIGADFAEYCWVKDNTKALCALKSIFTKANLSFDEASGKPTLDLNLLMGDLKKYKEFKARLYIPDGWRDFAETDMEHAESYFRPPITKEESEFLIRRKATSSNAPQAFTFQAGNRLHTTSVYVLNKEAITVKKLVNGEMVREQKSLIQILQELELNESAGENEISLIFPMYKSYDKIIEIINQFKFTMTTRRQFRPASKLVSLMLPRVENLPSLSVSNVARRLWFPDNKLHKVRGTRAEIEYAYSFYRGTLPWLRESLAETMKVSQLGALGVADALMALNVRPVTFTVLGPVKRNMPFEDTIRSIIRNCQLKMSVFDSAVPSVRPQVSELSEKIVLILTGPERIEHRADMVQALLTRTPLILPSTGDLKSKAIGLDNKKLGLIQMYFHDKARFQRSLNEVMLGKWGYYMPRRERSKHTGRYEGHNTFVGFLDGEIFNASIEGETIVQITFRSYERYRNIKDSLSALIDDEGWLVPETNNKNAELYALRNGTVTNSHKKSVALRFAEPALLPIFEESKYTVLRLKVGSDLRLRLTTMVNNREVTILGFAASAWRVKDLEERVVTSQRELRMIDIWAAKGSIIPEVFLSKAANIDRALRDDDERTRRAAKIVKEWVKDSFVSRIQKRFGDTLPVTQIQVEDENADESLYSQEIVAPEAIQFDLDNLIFDEGLEEGMEEAKTSVPIDTDKYIMDQPSDIFFASFMDAMSVMGFQQKSGDTRTTVDISSSHPFWDKVIKRIEDEGTKAYHLALSTTKYEVNGQVSAAMSRMLDNHERPEAVRQISRVEESAFF